MSSSSKVCVAPNSSLNDLPPPLPTLGLEHQHQVHTHSQQQQIMNRRIPKKRTAEITMEKEKEKEDEESIEEMKDKIKACLKNCEDMREQVRQQLEQTRLYCQEKKKEIRDFAKEIRQYAANVKSQHDHLMASASEPGSMAYEAVAFSSFVPLAAASSNIPLSSSSSSSLSSSSASSTMPNKKRKQPATIKQQEKQDGSKDCSTVSATDCSSSSSSEGSHKKIKTLTPPFVKQPIFNSLAVAALPPLPVVPPVAISNASATPLLAPTTLLTQPAPPAPIIQPLISIPVIIQQSTSTTTTTPSTSTPTAAPQTKTTIPCGSIPVVNPSFTFSPSPLASASTSTSTSGSSSLPIIPPPLSSSNDSLSSLVSTLGKSLDALASATLPTTLATLPPSSSSSSSSSSAFFGSSSSATLSTTLSTSTPSSSTTTTTTTPLTTEKMKSVSTSNSSAINVSDQKKETQHQAKEKEKEKSFVETRLAEATTTTTTTAKRVESTTKTSPKQEKEKEKEPEKEQQIIALPLFQLADFTIERRGNHHQRPVVSVEGYGFYRTPAAQTICDNSFGARHQLMDFVAKDNFDQDTNKKWSFLPTPFSSSDQLATCAQPYVNVTLQEKLGRGSSVWALPPDQMPKYIREELHGSVFKVLQFFTKWNNENKQRKSSGKLDVDPVAVHRTSSSFGWVVVGPKETEAIEDLRGKVDHTRFASRYYQPEELSEWSFLRLQALLTNLLIVFEKYDPQFSSNKKKKQPKQEGDDSS